MQLTLVLPNFLAVTHMIQVMECIRVRKNTRMYKAGLSLVSHCTDQIMSLKLDLVQRYPKANPLPEPQTIYCNTYSIASEKDRYRCVRS